MKVVLTKERGVHGLAAAEIEILDTPGTKGKAFGAFVYNFAENPEDANLRDGLAFFLEIPAWLRAAHHAGRKGEPFEIERLEVDEI